MVVFQLKLTDSTLPSKTALLQWKFVYFPINFDNNHWALCKIDTKGKTFFLMDSMQSEATLQVFRKSSKVCLLIMHVAWAQV
jgi:hypothetical protein